MRTTSGTARSVALGVRASLAFALGSLAGCAIGVGLDLDDGAMRVSEPDDEEPDAGHDESDREQPALDADSEANGDAGGSQDASSGDAGAAKDAAMDGTQADTGASPSSDAGASLDAAAAGHDAGASQDAGSGTGNDAGTDGGSSGNTRCTESSCTGGCSVVGPFPCCRENGSCGCSWAPGAYCM